MTQQRPDRMLTLKDFADLPEGTMESLLVDHFSKRVCSHLFGWLPKVRIGHPAFIRGELWLDSGRIRLAHLSANQTAAFLTFHKIYVNALGRELWRILRRGTEAGASVPLPAYPKSGSNSWSLAGFGITTPLSGESGRTQASRGYTPSVLPSEVPCSLLFG